MKGKTEKLIDERMKESLSATNLRNEEGFLIVGEVPESDFETILNSMHTHTSLHATDK